MKKETHHFYVIVGIMMMIMGGFSFVYGSIIPTTFFTINEIPSLIFRVSGVIFIVIGVGLLLYLRKHIDSTTEKEPNHP